MCIRVRKSARGAGDGLWASYIDTLLSVSLSRARPLSLAPPRFSFCPSDSFSLAPSLFLSLSLSLFFSLSRAHTYTHSWLWWQTAQRCRYFYRKQRRNCRSRKTPRVLTAAEKKAIDQEDDLNVNELFLHLPKEARDGALVRAEGRPTPHTPCTCS